MSILEATTVVLLETLHFFLSSRVISSLARWLRSLVTVALQPVRMATRSSTYSLAEDSCTVSAVRSAMGFQR